MESIKDSSDVGKEYVDISYNRSRYNVHIPRQKLREMLIENVDPEKIRYELSWRKVFRDVIDS